MLPARSSNESGHPLLCRYLDNNLLSGTIPSELGLLTELTGRMYVATSTTGSSCARAQTRYNGAKQGARAVASVLSNGACYRQGSNSKSRHPFLCRHLLYNRLSGTIPSELGLLTKLTSQMCVSTSTVPLVIERHMRACPQIRLRTGANTSTRHAGVPVSLLSPPTCIFYVFYVQVLTAAHLQ